MCNNFHQKNQNRRLKMGLTSHLSNAYNAFFSYRVSFLLHTDPDKDVFDDESDDDGSGSRFTIESSLSALCPLLFFEISVDHLCGLSGNGVTKSICCVGGIFPVCIFSRSNNYLVSSSEFLI